MENVGSHPILSFRKMLSQELSGENGDISREKVIEKLEENGTSEFHYKMAEKIQKEFEESYRKMIRLSDNDKRGAMPIQELMMQQEFSNQPDNEKLSELEIRILDTMTLNDIMQNYDRYYSVVVN